MAFRKRNVGLSSGSPRAPEPPSSQPSQPQLPGTRPSPLDGRLATSTGTPTLDNLLAGHAGLALGSSVLIEEAGTTDFAGALLRYYAAEGVVQGHIVHVVGVGEQWGRTLPGLIGAGEGEEKVGKNQGEKMKIAWRYERLGEFGAVAGARGGLHTPSLVEFRAVHI
jgi:elongator complex protein 4